MTTKNSAGPCPTAAGAILPNPILHRSSALGLAAGTLMSLCLAGPAVAQDANRLGLCSLSSGAVTALQSDVAAETLGDVEVAFVVVYSLNFDNNGQPLNGAATGPILCVNEDVTGVPSSTFATEEIPDDGGTVDIFDSAEAFLLRFEETESGEPETRFCHTTNANVDCFLLGPTPILE